MGEKHTVKIWNEVANKLSTGRRERERDRNNRGDTTANQHV